MSYLPIPDAISTSQRGGRSPGGPFRTKILPSMAPVYPPALTPCLSHTSSLSGSCRNCSSHQGERPLKGLLRVTRCSAAPPGCTVHSPTPYAFLHLSLLPSLSLSPSSLPFLPPSSLPSSFLHRDFPTQSAGMALISQALGDRCAPLCLVSSLDHKLHHSSDPHHIEQWELGSLRVWEHGTFLGTLQISLQLPRTWSAWLTSSRPSLSLSLAGQVSLMHSCGFAFCYLCS